jgi:hypothetical protein
MKFSLAIGIVAAPLALVDATTYNGEFYESCSISNNKNNACWQGTIVTSDDCDRACDLCMGKYHPEAILPKYANNPSEGICYSQLEQSTKTTSKSSSKSNSKSTSKTTSSKSDSNKANKSTTVKSTVTSFQCVCRAKAEEQLATANIEGAEEQGVQPEICGTKEYAVCRDSGYIGSIYSGASNAKPFATLVVAAASVVALAAQFF